MVIASAADSRWARASAPRRPSHPSASGRIAPASAARACGHAPQRRNRWACDDHRARDDALARLPVLPAVPKSGLDRLHARIEGRETQFLEGLLATRLLGLDLHCRPPQRARDCQTGLAIRADKPPNGAAASIGSNGSARPFSHSSRVSGVFGHDVVAAMVVMPTEGGSKAWSSRHVGLVVLPSANANQFGWFVSIIVSSQRGGQIERSVVALALSGTAFAGRC